MRVKEITVKTIVVKSNLPEADYVINPYVGCGHGCKYCYAEFMKKFTDHEEPWGEFVDVKVNSPELLNGNYKGKSIFMSSVTDPYQPVEQKYRVTRRILEKLLKQQPKLSILTKSSLVLRDIDLLSKFNNAEVGITITSLDDDVRKKFEPNSSSVMCRLDALKKLKEAGIRTYVFVGPILPFLTDVKQIIAGLEKDADSFWFENLNLRRTNWPEVEKILHRFYPNLDYQYTEIAFKKNAYWENYEKELGELIKKKGIKAKVLFH